MKVYIVVRFSPKKEGLRSYLYERGQDSVRIEGVYLSKTLATAHVQKIDMESLEEGVWRKQGEFDTAAIITKAIRGVDSRTLTLSNRVWIIKKLVD